MYWAFLIIANFPVFWGLGILIFQDIDEFSEALFFWLKPDLLSAFDGEYAADWWAEIKLGVWVWLCIGAVALEHYAISHFLY